jgi:hypothetical protein
MAKMNIGGKFYNIPDGASVSVVNNTVLVDGKRIPSDDVTICDVVIEGDTGSVRSDGSVTVKGNVNGSVDTKGSANTGNVTGDINAGGSVHASDITGSVNAGGSVNANKIGG